MKKILFSLVTFVLLVPVGAFGLPVTVFFDVADPHVQVGEQFTVNLVADIPEPVLGFGLDINFDPALLSLVSPPVIGPSWAPVPAMDGDGLAGGGFPLPISGLNVLLASLTFNADGVGTSDLIASMTPLDFTEGFPLLLAPPGSFAQVDFLSTSISIAAATVPEPDTIVLIAVGLTGLVFLLRKQKKMD